MRSAKEDAAAARSCSLRRSREEERRCALAMVSKACDLAELGADLAQRSGPHSRGVVLADADDAVRDTRVDVGNDIPLRVVPHGRACRAITGVRQDGFTGD